MQPQIYTSASRKMCANGIYKDTEKNKILNVLSLLAARRQEHF